ncbi:dihydrofolate reductase family protein [Nocardia brevicatena]|uniref:dihydrofolate reductase family protein n=1 Tax=Nocardia brevicatena TaxID=37327 RepID=UPI00031FDDB2|nr:dihydrofolate reductase family protein [Nocardia brevicatena]
MTNNITETRGRRVVANISLSLDGRVNGPGGEYDMGWVVPHAVGEVNRDRMVQMIQPATTALLGRKNYEGFGGYWPTVATDENADPRDRAFARWLDAVDKVVFSGTVSEPTWQNARITDSDPVTTVRELREQVGGDILVLASGSVIRALLAGGELDRLSITLCPEIAGSGDRLFEDGLPGTSWSLTDLSTTESGAIHLIYDRVPAAGPNQEGKRPMTVVEIRHRAPQRAVGVRTTVPLAELTRAQGQSLRELWQFLRERGITPAGAPFVRYHSMSETDTDVEVGVPITGGVEAAGRVECTELPGGRAVVAVHLGAHDRLQETYGLVESRVAETGRPDGASWEVYEWIDLTREPDPASWPAPTEWRTEIVQPIR